MLRSALRYLSLGFSVIPLRPCGKEPLVPWTEFQKRRASEQEVRSWFQQWPNANLGIVTGTISGVVVVDLDGQEGIEQAKKLSLTSNCISLTGDGKHLWYRHPGRVVENTVRMAPGIDLRGDGGYVVCAPSIHESGRRYRWLGNGIVSNVATLPIFPSELLTTSAATVSQTKKSKEEGWIAKALEEMKDGNIDNTLTSVLGRLRHDGYSEQDARKLLEPHALAAGAEEGHLEEKIENIWSRYEPKHNAESVGRFDNLRNGSIQIHSTERSVEGLIIHSPTNPDSLKQFEQLQLEREQSNNGTLRTGYSKLDQMFQGGLKSSRLFTIAALTSHGKTNFGIGLAKNICEQGKSVLYFSTEFTYQKIWQRYIAALKDPERFKEHKFNVCDGFTPSIEQVEEAIIQIKPDIFIFDFIQHVSKDKDKLTEFMKGCQFLQRKYNNQGIILAQLNRSADWVENGKRIDPRMSMIEGSATIEQSSSRVLLLSMTRSLPEYHEIDGYLVKNDDGDTGLVKFALYRNPYYIGEL